MRSIRIPTLFLLLLLPLWSAKSQEKAESETDIHKNVRLIEMPAPQDMPEEFKGKYQAFLQQLKTAIEANTSEHESTNALTIQVRAGIKEVGSNKTKRPIASIVGFRKDSKTEYYGDILLYSYLTGADVNKDEIESFLNSKILNFLK
jgi:hypothetical protein